MKHITQLVPSALDAFFLPPISFGYYTLSNPSDAPCLVMVKDRQGNDVRKLTLDPWETRTLPEDVTPRPQRTTSGYLKAYGSLIVTLYQPD